MESRFAIKFFFPLHLDSKIVYSLVKTRLLDL